MVKQMVVEQYRLILQHRIIDTDNIDMVHGKLEPDKVCEYNFDYDKSNPIAKSEAIKRLLYEMGRMDGAE